MHAIRLTLAAGIALALASATPAAAAPVVLTGPQLTAALLAPPNVPGGGWAAAPADALESEPRTQANHIEGGWCGGATDAYAAGELHPSAGVVATFQKVVTPDEPYWFVWETLWSFQETFGHSPVQQAKNYIATMKGAAVECDSWMTSGGEIINSVSAEVAPFSRVGNQRVALRVTTAGDGVTEQTDVVYVRAANNVAVIHTRILPPDSTLLKKIVKSAVKKLQQAAAAA